MTLIKKLVMDGFKSFARKTELVFDNHFNVILGANGSGKSNVLDALCFVLGKSSSKAMRAEKTANLIYNGGKTKKPAKQALVSLVFCNESGIFPVEQKEVTISRIVKPTGASKYMINDKTSTRTAIIELLACAKIDPNGYNIVLQGDIIRLIEMSSVERRGIIEEIAGIEMYEDKKQKAVRELDKVELRLNEAEIVLTERKTYLKDLKKDRDQAQRYQDLNDRIKQNKASYLKIQIDKKEEVKSKIDARHKKQSDKLDSLQTKVKKRREEVKTRKDRVNEISKEIEDKGEKEQVVLQKEIEKFKVAVASKKTRVDSCKTELTKIAKKEQQIEVNLGDIDKRIIQMKGDEEALGDILKKKKSTITELADKIEKFKIKHKLNTDDQLEKKIDTLDEDAERLQKESGSVREQHQQLLREQDRIEFQLQAVDEKIEKVLEVEKEHAGEIKQLKQQKKQFKDTVLDLNSLLNKDSESARELAKLRKDLYSLREKQHGLEVKQAGIRAAQNANIAVKRILENKKSFPGVHDVVTGLARVDDKYAMALEIAAGAKINGIVVDDDKTASDCIRYLKENRLGVATFFPLNKIRGARIPETAKLLANKPGVFGFATDLVDYDPRFKNVFSHVFGSVLVVQDIVAARRIGIGSAKMVTLDGDYADVSGSMKGGFRQKKGSGRFKGAQLQKQLDATLRDCASYEGKMGLIESERKIAESRIVRLRQLKASLEGEIIKKEKSLHLESDDLGVNQQYKKELRDKLVSTKKKLEEVEQILSGFTRQIRDLKINRQILKNTMAELRNPTVLAELNAYSQKKRQVAEEVMVHEAELRSVTMQRTDIFERDRENSQKILKEGQKERSQFQTEIDTLTTEVQVIEVDLKVKEQQQTEFYSQFKGLFEERNKLSDEVNIIEGEILVTEDEARKVELILNSFSIELARHNAELSGFLGEFEQYHGVELNKVKSEQQLKREINEFEKLMANIGSVNMRALELYDIVKKEYESLLEKKDTLHKERLDVLSLMEEIEGKKAQLFFKAFDEVGGYFSKIFAQLSTKGAAFIELEDKENPFNGGMNIKVRLTGNKFLDIRSLSGGEKTLTALAFMFALQEHDPASFYLFDEVDAALDKKNSTLLGKLIQRYCTKAQYVVISHNDELIQQATALYGVSLRPDGGQSQVVSLKI
jgi:chromosome segregation protein